MGEHFLPLIKFYKVIRRNHLRRRTGKYFHWLFIEKGKKEKERTKKERKVHEDLVVERRRSSARLQKGFTKVFGQNFEEFQLQNSQFRKALIIILTIFLGGSLTQDFEERLFCVYGLSFMSQ